jgi:hypothetical protein
MIADSVVDWSALGQVVLYSLIAGIGVPAIYALAVLGAGRSMDARRAGRGIGATLYASIAFVGAAACLGAIAYGIYLLAHKS